MKIGLRVLTCVISAASMAACNKSDNNTNAAPVTMEQRVPEKLTFTPPTSGTPLTAAQAKEVEATFARKAITLPPGELIFPDEKLSTEDKVKMEKELKAADPIGYDLLQDIRLSCGPKSQSSVNPKEGLNDPKVGDKVTANISVSLGGSTCAVDVAQDLGLQVSVDELTKATETSQSMTRTTLKSLGMSGSMDSKGKALVLAPKYQKWLQSRGIVVTSSMSGLVFSKENLVKATGGFSLAGKYTTLDKEIPFSTDLKILINTKNNVSLVEIIYSFELTFPTFKVSVVAHSITENGKVVVSESYINGNKADVKQTSPGSYQMNFSRLFHDQVPGIGNLANSELLKIITN